MVSSSEIEYIIVVMCKHIFISRFRGNESLDVFSDKQNVKLLFVV